MKKLMKGMMVVLLFTFFGCQKTTGVNGTLVRDCSGTYLKIDNKDWQICNTDKVATIDDGTTVTVSFKKISDCQQQGVVCLLYHANEGWITILDIK